MSVYEDGIMRPSQRNEFVCMFVHIKVPVFDTFINENLVFFGHFCPAYIFDIGPDQGVTRMLSG